MTALREALARWRGTVAYVILAVAVAIALANSADQAEERDRDRTHDAAVHDMDQARADRAQASAQVRVLRAACEDRNQRDRKIAFGLARVTAKLDASPDDVEPVLDALAPRDCDRLYPMPTG